MPRCPFPSKAGSLQLTSEISARLSAPPWTAPKPEKSWSVRWRAGREDDRPVVGNNDKTLVGVLSFAFIIGLVLLRQGWKSMGARGTRVGLAVLEEPDRIFSIKYFVRKILVSGVPVRDVRVLAISIDRGDALEVHLAPHEVAPTLAAFNLWLEGHAQIEGAPSSRAHAA